MKEFPKPYQFEEARDEAEKLSELIKSGEAQTYDEAERIFLAPESLVLEVKGKNETAEKENWQKFKERIKDFPHGDFLQLCTAYDLAKICHKGQFRDGGERYFEHLRNAALILFDECNIRDPKMLTASLLHDSVEDSFIFGHSSSGHSALLEMTRYRLSRLFNSEIAEMVITLTKPKPDGVEIKDKRDAHHIYMEGLSQSSSETIMVKMADRLHNLRSLGSVSPERQKKIIKETEEEYYPIFEKVVSEFPEEGQRLLNEMEKAISILR